jgi:hypothetical protein
MTKVVKSFNFRNDGTNTMSLVSYYVQINEKTGTVTSGAVSPNKVVFRTDKPLKIGYFEDLLGSFDQLYGIASQQYVGSHMLDADNIYVFSGETCEIQISQIGHLLTQLSHGPAATFDGEIIVEYDKP